MLSLPARPLWSGTYATPYSSAMGLHWPFRGREDELERISAAVSSPAVSGLVIAGAAGVGKTRLMLEAFERADLRRHTAHWVLATRATSAIPFGALASLLPAGLPLATPQTNLLRLAADALIAEAAPHRPVVGIDDAHQLDGVSAALLHLLIRTRQAFVLVTVRSGEPAPEPIMALWKEDLAERLELRPLSGRDVEDVLTAALGGQIEGATVQRLWATAKRNTLLLRELVLAGIDSGALTEVEGVWRWEGPWVIAPRLVELIGARIGRLEADEKALLEILAYGEPLGVQLLARLVSPQALDAMATKDLLEIEHDRRRVLASLAHPLYGEVLREQCPELRARKWRSQLADAVEATGARRFGDWLRVAAWRLSSGLPASPELLVAAARQAFVALDLPLAERMAKSALEAGGGLSAARILWRVLLLADPERHAEAEAMLGRLAEAPATDAVRAELAIGRANILFWGQGQADRASEVVRVAMASATERRWHDELALLEASFLAHTAQVLSAARAIDQLLGQSALRPRVEVHARYLKGITLNYVGRSEEAIAVLNSVIEPLARWAGELPWVVEGARLTLSHAQLFAGRLTEAERLAAESYASAVDRNWEPAILVHCTTRAQAALFRGRAAEAVPLLREGLAIYRRSAPAGFHFVSLLLGQLAHAEALAGDAQAAQVALAESDQTRRPSLKVLWLWAELARPWVAIAQGDQAQAIELAHRAADLARASGGWAQEAFALHDLVRLGSPRASAGRLAELAATAQGELIGLMAAHAAAAAAGDGAALDRVADALASLGANLLAAEALAQASRAHDRAGQWTRSRRSRARAGFLMELCGGIRTPALEKVEILTLTQREHHVAKLAAAGLSNRKIAERLVLSKRTVDNHLHKVYAKLGIAGRAELGPLLSSRRPGKPETGM